MPIYRKRSGIAPAGTLKVSVGGGTYTWDDLTLIQVTITDPIAVGILRNHPWIEMVPGSDTTVPQSLSSFLSYTYNAGQLPDKNSVLTATADGFQFLPPGATSPPQGEAVPLWTFTHSYGDASFLATNGYTSNTAAAYKTRVQNRLRSSALGGDFLSGGWAQDVAQGMLGTIGNQWVPNNKGIIVLDCLQNDYMNNGLDATAMDAVKQSLRAMLWTAFSSAKTAESAAAFTYPSGTWTAANTTVSSGGSNKFTTSANAQASIAFTGTDCVLLFQGTTVAAGTSTVQLDGSTIATVSHSSRTFASTSSRASTKVFLPVPMLGMSNTAHTITVTKDAGTGTAYIDDLLTIGTSPPLVLVMKALYLPAYTGNGSDAAVTAYNSMVDSMIAAEFTAWPVVAVDPNVGFDKTTMVSANPTFARHPNDRGMAKIADNIVTAVAASSWHHGAQTLN